MRNRYFLWVFLVLLLPGFLTAETPSPSPSPTPPVLEVKDVVTGLEQLTGFLREAAERSKDDSRITEVIEGLDRTKRALADEIIRRTAVGVLERRSLKQLIELDAELITLRKRLDDWNGILTQRIGELASLRAQLLERTEVWTRTVAVLEKDGNSKIVRNLAQPALSELELATRSVQRSVDRLLLVQAELGSQVNVLQERIGNIGRAKAAVQTQLFVHDARPFFLGEYESSVSGSGLDIQGEVRSISEYLSRLDSRFAVQIAILLFVLWGIVRLRRFGSDALIVQLFTQRPLSVLLAVFLFSALLLYRDAPERLIDIIWTVLLVPVTSLAIRIVPTRYASVLFGGLILFLVDSFDVAMRSSPSIKALFLCGELCFGALLLFRYGALLREKELDSRPRSLLFLVQSLFFVLLLSAFLVLAGYWRLGTFLGEGALESAYVGAGLTVLAALLNHSSRDILYSSWGTSKLRSLPLFQEPIQRSVGWLVTIFALVAWIISLLTIFGIRAQAADIFHEGLSLGFDIGKLHITLQGLILFAILLAVSYKISGMVRALLREEIYSRYSVDRGIQLALETAIHYILLTLGVLLGLAALGVNPQSLAIVAGALSVGAGFGLQHVVNNLVSGIIVLWERPIRLGDIITVGGVNGSVSRISLRSTTIRTADEAEVIIPNAKLVGEQVTNFTHSSSRARIALPLLVAHETNIQSCLETLQEALRSSTRLLSTPPPEVWFRGFRENGLEFLLTGWVGDVAIKFGVESDILLAIARLFAEKGIVIARPQREVTLLSKKEE